MSSPSLLAIAVLQLAHATGAPELSHGKAFIPTSVALEIAEKVAKDQGYQTSDKRYFFDLLLTENRHPPIPGFITMEFYGGNHPILQIAISETTGQIVDSTSCTSFEYPDLKSFQEEVQRETGVHPLTIDDLAAKIGCSSLQRLSRPVRVR